MNPLMPAGYDIVFGAVAVLVIAFTVVAFISYLRAPVTGLKALLWALVILFVPVLGPLGWFAYRPDRTTVATN